MHMDPLGILVRSKKMAFRQMTKILIISKVVEVVSRLNIQPG